MIRSRAPTHFTDLDNAFFCGGGGGWGWGAAVRRDLRPFRALPRKPVPPPLRENRRARKCFSPRLIVRRGGEREHPPLVSGARENVALIVKIISIDRPVRALSRALSPFSARPPLPSPLPALDADGSIIFSWAFFSRTRRSARTCDIIFLSRGCRQDSPARTAVVSLRESREYSCATARMRAVERFAELVPPTFFLSLARDHPAVKRLANRVLKIKSSLTLLDSPYFL